MTWLKCFNNDFILLLLVQTFFAIYAQAEPLQTSLLEFMSSYEHANLKGFSELVKKDAIANSTLQLRPCTVFVPLSEEIAKVKDQIYVSYHMTTVPMLPHEFTKTIPSDFDGNPLLYITKRNNGAIFINNAFVNTSGIREFITKNNKRQILYPINAILEPLTFLPTAKTQIINPNAWEFLQQSDLFNIGDNRLRTYRSQVTLMRKESLYQSPGGHTYLIPIDEAFRQTTRSSLVDKKVIDGHVILNNVIFRMTYPDPLGSSLEDPYTTAAFEDNIKVTISFYEDRNLKYVKSNTLVGDAKHPRGVVIAQIVKANIPVNNGVVHLIDRPLMIIDTTVKQFLESLQVVNDKNNAPLRKFYEIIMEIGGEVLDDISQLDDVTILVPTDEAWNAAKIENYIGDREKMRNIINMHIIKGRVNIEKIRQANQNVIGQFPTLDKHTFLYFNIKGDDSNEIITVEGGGVNATLEIPDLAQTNGFVHVIDKVLGLPEFTILEKLQNDPMLSATYQIGEFSSFNKQLNNTERRYTYFVPRDRAWQRIEIDYPSVHKKMFMKDFSYHSRCTLERHLIIADDVYTMDHLAKLTKNKNESIILPTFRDSLKVRVEKEVEQLHDEHGSEWTGYVIIWNYKRIHVYRPDVECTNGIIHVIDYPLLEKKDIVVSGGSYMIHTNIYTLLTNIITLAVVKKFF